MIMHAPVLAANPALERMGTVNPSWTRPLLISINGRRYTPGKPNDPSSVRTERYTYTSGYEVQSGTRTPLHSPKARVEMIDLSDISSPQ